MLSFVFSTIFLIIGFIFIPKENRSCMVMSTSLKLKEKKPRINKHKSKKKAFISDEEWNTEDEEDDEMFFIEEHFEDD